jgi:guanylate kinase
MSGQQLAFDPEAEMPVGAPGAILAIVSGPSGVGKDTIIAALHARDPEKPDYHYVVTCTTRAPRPGEIDGVSYQFLDDAEFLALRDKGDLLEANRVHDHWSGTPRRQVAEERVPEALLIFVVPPSQEALFQRLRSRATETAEELELRQRNAAIELARAGDYDQVVVNETGMVDRTAAEIEAIIAQEKRRHPDRRLRV